MVHWSKTIDPHKMRLCWGNLRSFGAKHTAGTRQSVGLLRSFCLSRVWRSLIHTLKAFYSATHVAMASTTSIHFSEVLFLKRLRHDPSILYIIFHCRLPSAGPLSALGF